MMRKLFTKILTAVVLTLGVMVAPMAMGAEATFADAQDSYEDGGGNSSGIGTSGGGSGNGAYGNDGCSAGDPNCNPNKLPETSILPNNMGIEDILKLVLKVLVYGLGVAATLGVVIAGIMYLTARDSEAQVAQAKKRLIEIIIGLVAWGVMFSVLNWLVPGGMGF